MQWPCHEGSIAGNQQNWLKFSVFLLASILVKEKATLRGRRPSWLPTKGRGGKSTSLERKLESAVSIYLLHLSASQKTCKLFTVVSTNRGMNHISRTTPTMTKTDSKRIIPIEQENWMEERTPVDFPVQVLPISSRNFLRTIRNGPPPAYVQSAERTLA